ncbi:MAG: hypothetical protein LBO05_12115 [Deltaproteobacteria bacterium]|jgi:hypothetical protein|nr:hypothetical protein [Deltaproteobacteria bacterium]
MGLIKSVITKSIFLFFVILLTGPNYLLAQSDSEPDFVPESCLEYKFDPAAHSICEVARRFNVPFYQAAMIFFLANSEATASYCDFTLTGTFHDAKAHFLTSGNSVQLYHYIINIFDESRITNKSTWCKVPYDMVGPKPPPGPNGGGGWFK